MSRVASQHFDLRPEFKRMGYVLDTGVEVAVVVYWVCGCGRWRGAEGWLAVSVI